MQIIKAANGAEFVVVSADSYTARMARNVHPVTMADGTVWTAGAGRPGMAIAWQATTPR
ncbi:hypothetical protein [Streptomyces noursei]|uniref:hypothetical protein n=1 Tax=Streptomyces noursei TaxID=1971 RepID=UPI0035DB052B